MSGSSTQARGREAAERRRCRGRPARLADRLPIRSPRAGVELLAVALLSALLAGLLAITALRAPARLAFAVDQLPPGAVLYGFYELERGELGPYRWSKPEAALVLPVAAPGTYRVTLSLRESPAAPSGRTLTIYLGAEPAGTASLDVFVREYTTVGRLAPPAWAEGWRHALAVELQTTGFAPPGDQRALGVSLAGVAVEPVDRWEGLRRDLAALILPNLLLLGAAYAMLRLLGLGAGPVSGLLGAAVGGYALLVAAAPSLALALAYEPVHQPLPYLGAVAVLLATPLLARAPERWPALLAGGSRRPGWGAAQAGARGLGEALWLFLLLRLTLSLFAFLAAVSLELRGPCSGAEPAPTLYATGLPYRLLGVWQRWDGCWYEKIAALGYRPGDPSINFLPLYPVLMRAFSVPLGGSLTLGGLAVSAVAYVAALVGLYQLVGADFGAAVARRTMLALSLFPAGFFLFAPFSESLFLALAVWALLLARRGAWGWAALPALLIGLTRPQGCLLALPLAWEAWRQWHGANRHGDAAGPAAPPPGPRRLLAPLVATLPVCGLLGFLAYGELVVGRTTLDTQGTQWGNSPRAPWTVLAASWAHAARAGDTIEAINLALVVLALGLLALGLRRLPLAYTLYAAPQVLLIVAHQNAVAPLLAASRYLLVVFPLFVVVGLAGRWRRVHYPWLIVSTTLLYLFYLFLSGPIVA